MIRPALALVVVVATLFFACGDDDGKPQSGSDNSVIPVGAKPWAVALDEDRGRLYAANEFDSIEDALAALMRDRAEGAPGHSMSRMSAASERPLARAAKS